MFDNESIIDLLAIIDEIKEIVQVTSDLNICRDKKDNFLLNLAKDSNAQFLITEDVDLLEVKSIGITVILKYQDFVKRKLL